MEKVKNDKLGYNIQWLLDVSRLCDTMRICPKVSTQTSIAIHQNKRRCDALVKEYNEELETLREKHAEDKDALEKAFRELNKKSYVPTTALNIIERSKFPGEREEFGSKEIHGQTNKGELMVNRVNYFDAFVELLTMEPSIISEKVTE